MEIEDLYDCYNAESHPATTSNRRYGIWENVTGLHWPVLAEPVMMELITCTPKTA